MSRQILKVIGSALLAVALAACGGSAPGPATPPGGGTGGGDGGTGGGSAPTVAVSLTNSAGQPTNSITLAAPGTATAVVTASGAPVANTLVQFSLGTTTGQQPIAAFNPASGTAITDSTGRASVSILAASSQAQGATTLNASASVNGSQVSGSTAFQVGTTSIALQNMTVTPASIAALGTATVQVTVAGVPTTVPVTVNFASSCAAAGTATLTNSAVTSNGVATATYTDRGCNAQDTITASATGAAQPATVALTITPAPPTNIEFRSATPSAIAIAGSGGPASSSVVFRVVNSAQQPVANFPVRLALSTAPGGVTIDSQAGPITKNTAQDGTVSVTVTAGSQPGPVQVTATAVNVAGLSAVSSQLSIQSGLPTQSRFSLSVQTFNIEGLTRDGTTTSVTIRAADRVGNPVPDGTAVNFRSSGAAIQPSCRTTNGQCSVTFVSQNNRPVAPLPAGRVNILAWAAGEESFNDANGNNRYDAGEAFGDLGDPFVDASLNGTFDAATDEYIPYSTTAASACPAPGTLGFPSRTNTCDGAWGASFVRQWAQVVLSGSSPGALALPGTVPLSATAPNCSGDLAFDLFDVNQNPMPAGTTVSVTLVGGEVTSQVLGTPVVNTIGRIPGLEAGPYGTRVGVTLSSTQCSGNNSKSTQLRVNVTSPGGLTTIIGPILVTY